MENVLQGVLIILIAGGIGALVLMYKDTGVIGKACKSLRRDQERMEIVQRNNREYLDNITNFMLEAHGMKETETLRRNVRALKSKENDELDVLTAKYGEGEHDRD